LHVYVTPAGGKLWRFRYEFEQELGALAAFLCSVSAAQLNGVALPVDGGWLAR
jgi:NAD(P)-dependent dehydrogenase (short-subunit alcohol dehydrogenase family)